MPADQSTVTYREINGHPGYRVGDDGSAWCCRKLGVKDGRIILDAVWRPLKIIRGGRYFQIGFKGYTRRIHLLVLEAFVGPRPPGMDGCHNDGDPANNALSNLRWDTAKGNMADCVKHGTTHEGEKHGAAKLTDEQVVSIRAEHATGGVMQSELAEKYHVSRASVCNILKKKSWKHLA